MDKFIKTAKKSIPAILAVLFVAAVLIVSLRGNVGNPSMTQLSTLEWKGDGPFELSPERGRFALIYSIVEEKSVFFSRSTAEFASPDVGVNDGKYVSIFAPLLSFLVAPGYLIGKAFGMAQIGTFFVISLFALINVILLRSIAIKLGANPLAASIGSLVFIFGTPAFAYAVNLYQHHISTFLLLISIYALLRFKNFISSVVIFLALGFSIPLDYPNLFILAPLAIYAGLKTFSIEKIKQKISFRVNVYKIFIPLVMIVPILSFLWFNQVSYGNPFKLSGTVQPANLGVKNIEAAVDVDKLTGEEAEGDRSAVGFLETRNILNGFYILFVSPDRGIIYYSPVILFGIVGFFLAYKRNLPYLGLFGSVIGANILLYSMWGDPWGGWAFGSRYLIPTYAILAIFISLLLTYWRKKIWLIVPFVIVAIYSIAVNTLGAITTSALPPQIQVLELEKLSGVIQRYTYQKNWEFLLAGNSKSFVYQEFLKGTISPVQFYEILTLLIVLALSGLCLYYYLMPSRKGEKNV